MMEVFIAYTRMTPMTLLSKTLNAWECTKYEPVAIMVKDTENDNLIHIAAECVANGKEYMVAKLGTTPNSKKGVIKYKKGQGIKVEACQPRVQ